MRLVDEEARGDPQGPLRWTAKSVRQLAEALGERVRRRLRDALSRGRGRAATVD